MRRVSKPTLSVSGQQALERYATYLECEVDSSAATVRNYLSDLQQFIAWCEATWAEGQEQGRSFMPAAMTTLLLTRYRSYLQHTRGLKPASVNRALVTIKRYAAWATDQTLIPRNPATPVKLIPAEASAPRQLEDDEEDALVTAVTTSGSLRDRTIIVFMLHTGLRAREVCLLQRQHVTLGKRSGRVQVYGKRNKYREVPLNATARQMLTDYLVELPKENMYLFPSEKTHQALTERALGHLVKKYAQRANLRDVSPHDLRHRFGYRMAESVPLHRLAQIMGHDSLDTTLLYIRGSRRDLQREVEKIAWM
jgi:integrase/recombinase XerC